MLSTLLEQCVHEKLKSLPEETVGQVGYSSDSLWKNVPKTGISECHILSCSFVTYFSEERWQICFHFCNSSVVIV